jgi:hypothetical protein
MVNPTRSILALQKRFLQHTSKDQRTLHFDNVKPLAIQRQQCSQQYACSVQHFAVERSSSIVELLCEQVIVVRLLVSTHPFVICYAQAGLL